MADRLSKGLVLLRKAGKLPGETLSATYDLEYGQAALEVKRNAILDGERILVIDDLLATGGTAQAASQLIEQCRATVVQMLFLIELRDLGGGKPARSDYGRKRIAVLVRGVLRCRNKVGDYQRGPCSE